MYSKEQIIQEMKRIAATMGGTLSERDFEQHSTVPLTTLRFHLGSWQRALKEAGLTFVEKTPEIKSKSNDELLLELIRLYKDSGELPTTALVDTKGKYKAHHYKERWKSIADAFQQAKEKFPEKFKASQKKDNLTELRERKKLERMEQLEKLEQLEKEEQLKPEEFEEQLKPGEHEEQIDQEDQLAKTIVSGNIREEYDPEVTIFESEVTAPESEVTEPESEVTVLEEEYEVNHDDQDKKKEKIKFIPQTIKPQKAKMKPEVSAEPIDFRGLKFAPASRQGVIYLFGMISDELGFLIESFISEFPDCEGKRCVDHENDQWEPVRIQLEYKSSDFKKRVSAKGYDESQCDLIICWNHNWKDSPIEVLELRSILEFLE
jgi:hypothetical protein